MEKQVLRCRKLPLLETLGEKGDLLLTRFAIDVVERVEVGKFELLSNLLAKPDQEHDLAEEAILGSSIAFNTPQACLMLS
jgi:hypothetical protein